MNVKMDRPSEVDAQGSTLPSPNVFELRLKKILCATDFSECSQKAFHYAVSLGKQFNAEILLLHVFETLPPQVGILEGAFMDTTIHEDAVRQLEEWRRRVSPAVEAKTAFRDGIPTHKQIVAGAKEFGADLIVIGNHGRNALGRALMGNTAEKVVRFAPCPVLVIRQQEHDFISESE
jgi:universal stress protein A